MYFKIRCKVGINKSMMSTEGNYSLKTKKYKGVKKLPGSDIRKLRSEVLGSDVLGSDVLGSDVLGSDVLGTDVLGSDVLRSGGSKSSVKLQYLRSGR